MGIIVSKEAQEPHGFWRTIMCAILALCPLVCGAAEGSAASGRELNRHFIILFDELVKAYSNVPGENIYKNTRQMLEYLKFDASRDYVSIGGYGLNLIDPDFDNLIQVYTDSKEREIRWRRLNNAGELRELITWKPRTARWEHATAGSMQSLAKEYGIMKFKVDEGSDLIADETYVICITDNVINGSVNSYQQEWTSVEWESQKKFDQLKPGVFSTIDRFKSWLDLDLIEHDFIISSISKKPYKVAAYRVRPKLEPAIGASVELLTQVRRSRGGYNVGFFYPEENANYRVTGIHFNDNLADEYALQVSDDAQWVNLRPESRDIDSLVVMVDVHLVDGYYNGIRFSGLNPHYYGLKIKQKMMMFDEPKILGFFKMPNWMWWWFPGDIYAAVHVWDLIIVLILLIVVCYAFYKAFVRITTYKPSLKNIDITYMK